MNSGFELIRNRAIGNVESVSPREIRVIINSNAPQCTAINASIPQLFPKINGILIVPNEAGALIGMISWVGIEYAPFPPKLGNKDYDLIDLPFPLRRLSLVPLGILKKTEMKYEVERGVYSYPSVGDVVVLPSQEELKAIVQNREGTVNVNIGTSPIALNAPVYINPDRLFGRHTAVLGNTGSGKSCSVAGLVRWSIETAKQANNDNEINSRFIVLDPNGEYGEAFQGISTVKRYQVLLRPDQMGNMEQLKVPSWMWNSYEWSSISLATGKTQRPLLRQTLREVRGGSENHEGGKLQEARRFLTSALVSLRQTKRTGVSALTDFPQKQNLGDKLASFKNSLTSFLDTSSEEANKKIKHIINVIERVLNLRKGSNGYYGAFEIQDIDNICDVILAAEPCLGALLSYVGPDEDSPVFFSNEVFLNHIQRLTQETGAQTYMDFFLMRVNSILSDTRIASVIETKSSQELTLVQWLSDYIGSCEKGQITIIDLSLLPAEILHVIVSVLARVIFEAHQRYRRLNGVILPTTLIVEEAHNFIRRYETESEEISSVKLCSQAFEKIAKEGRKFGLGLLVSSQRPSELSQTVLSQCNTFLLHRLVNDKDQEMVKKLVPDNLGNILNELPVLPTRKAILLGWAAPIPILIEVRKLEESQQPKSQDPEFWNVWIGKSPRKFNWNEIADDWQNQQVVGDTESSKKEDIGDN